MNVCFIIHPWDTIKPKDDTTLALIQEYCKRKHVVTITTPAKLTIRDK